MPSLAQHRHRRSLGLCVNCEVPTVEKARCDACLEKQRVYYAGKRAKRKKAKRCINCGRPPKAGLTKCRKCYNASQIAGARKRRKLREDGRCFACRQPTDNPGRDCSRCCAVRREKYRQLRDEVFAAYGGYRCACPGCDVTEPDFLQIDHVNNDGKQHRKVIGQGRTYFWLKKNNFPSDFQVLCANCNFAKGHYGTCPHTRAPVAPADQPTLR